MIGNLIKNRKGFTLVELLIIIAIISILFSVILVAVDPARRFAEARNAVRQMDVRDILEAILTYTVDFKCNLPAGIDNLPGTSQILGTKTTGCGGQCTATTGVGPDCLDLTSSLVETYLSAIPADPGSGSAANTDYFVNKTAGGRILVGACDPERGASTRVSR